MTDERFALPGVEEVDLAPAQPAEGHLAVEHLGNVAIKDESADAQPVEVRTDEQRLAEDLAVRERHLRSTVHRADAYQHGARMPRGRGRPGGRAEWRSDQT